MAVLTGGWDSEVGFEDLDGISMMPAKATCSGEVCSVCVVSVNIRTSCGCTAISSSLDLKLRL